MDCADRAGRIRGMQSDESTAVSGAMAARKHDRCGRSANRRRFNDRAQRNSLVAPRLFSAVANFLGATIGSKISKEMFIGVRKR